MPKPRPSSQRSTLMPSVKLELGKYVTLRPRADGTARVFFQVPERLRPSDWPSLTPLPLDAPRTGDLSDAVEVSRIQADARALYERLQAARAGRAAEDTGRTFKTLVRAWQKSEAWKAMKPRTHKHYGTYVNHILAWADVASPRPDPVTVNQSGVETLLALFDAQPVTKKHVRKTIRLLMSHAIAMGWRKDNPCTEIRLRRAPKSKAGIWEQADVDAYVAAADELGYASISLIILMEWEIGQRLGDVRGFRPGAEWKSNAGVFEFDQEKTGNPVAIPVSERLRFLLDEASRGTLLLFKNERTGKGYTEERLSKTFAWVRNAAVKKGARTLLLRWLRHSCVVHLSRAGCTVPEIAAITGHSPAGVYRILATYLPRDSTVARNAQEKRGLVQKEVA